MRTPAAVLSLIASLPTDPNVLDIWLSVNSSGSLSIVIFCFRKQYSFVWQTVKAVFNTRVFMAHSKSTIVTWRQLCNAVLPLSLSNLPLLSGASTGSATNSCGENRIRHILYKWQLKGLPMLRHSTLSLDSGDVGNDQVGERESFVKPDSDHSKYFPDTSWLEWSIEVIIQSSCSIKGAETRNKKLYKSSESVRRDGTKSTEINSFEILHFLCHPHHYYFCSLKGGIIACNAIVRRFLQRLLAHCIVFSP